MDPDQGASKKDIQDEINSLSKLLIDIGYDITKIQTDTSLTDQERRDKLRVARQAEESEPTAGRKAAPAHILQKKIGEYTPLYPS